MIEVPAPLMIAQWALLISALGLVVVMYRQLAHVLKVTDYVPPGQGLDPGESAPGFTYTPVANGQRHTFSPAATPSLLIFADPDCASCITALHALEAMAPGERYPTVKILVVTDAPTEKVRQVPAFASATVEIGRVDRTIASELYRVELTPSYFVIDEGGVVQSRGTLTDEADLAAALEEAAGADGRRITSQPPMQVSSRPRAAITGSAKGGSRDESH